VRVADTHSDASPVVSAIVGAPAVFVDRLRTIVGDAYVQTDPDVVAAHVVDFTGRFRGATPAVVRPGSVDEVVGVLRACSETGTAIVPQGGNS